MPTSKSLFSQKINSSQNVENWQVISHNFSLLGRRFQHPQKPLTPASTVTIQSSEKDNIQFPHVTSFPSNTR